MCERGECSAERTGWKLPRSSPRLSDRVRPQRSEAPPGRSLYQLQPMQSALSARNRHPERIATDRPVRRTTETRDAIKRKMLPPSLEDYFLSQKCPSQLGRTTFRDKSDRPNLGELLFVTKVTVPTWEDYFSFQKCPSQLGRGTFHFKSGRPNLGRLLFVTKVIVPTWEDYFLQKSCRHIRQIWQTSFLQYINSNTKSYSWKPKLDESLRLFHKIQQGQPPDLEYESMLHTHFSEPVLPKL